MVIDPVTALGIAGNAIQFIDFASKLVSRGGQYYRSVDGALIEHTELSAVGDSLRRLNLGLDTSMRLQQSMLSVRQGDPPRQYTLTEQGLWDANNECYKVAVEFGKALEDLKISQKHGKWQSFRQAFRSMWSEERIDMLTTRLSRAREQLMTHLLVHMSSQNALNHDTVFEAVLTSGTVVQKSLTLIQKSILGAIQQSYAGIRKEVATLSSSLEGAKVEERAHVLSGWQADNKANLDILSGQLFNATENALVSETQNKLLDSLYFTRIEERRERIPEAHKQTLRWIFGGVRDDGTRWDDFKRWLEDRFVQKNLFWVSGKAGSGKSTLMRFLDDHDATKQYLRGWASAKNLLVASCFFWKAGTPIQKSLIGLLRSLLHQMLSQDRTLIAEVDPWRWRALYLGSSHIEDWTDIELKKAFDRLIKAAQPTTRIALFVDGLDEFDGDDEQRQNLIDMFIGTAGRPDIKICISSRPWNIFQDAFAEYPKLRLELLTREDIKHYVQDVLQGSARFRKFCQIDSTGCDGMITEIVDKASGVFLWVHLVVRELHKGFRDGLDLRMLRKKLHKLPGDLDAYFLQMINSIDASDRSTASALFQIVLNARQHVTLITLSFSEEECADFALEDAYIRDMQLLVISHRNESMARRLNSLCMGLLEPKEIVSFIESQNSSVSLSSWKWEVDYLHRTVRDFLLGQESQQTLRAYTNGTYDTDRYLVNAFASQMMLLNALPRNEPEETRTFIRDEKSSLFVEFLDEFMFYTERIEKLTKSSPTAVIKKTKDVVIHQVPKIHGATMPSSWQSNIGWEAFGHWKDWNCSFCTLAIQYNIGLYAMTALKTDLRRGKTGRPPLDFALRRWTSSPRTVLLPNREVVAAILSLGADPNEIYDDLSIWAHFVAYLDRQNLRGSTLDPAWAQATELLINHGAAKSFRTSRTGASKEVFDDADRALSVFFDDDTAHRLQELFTKRSSSRRRFISKFVQMLN